MKFDPYTPIVCRAALRMFIIVVDYSFFYYVASGVFG